VLEEAEGGEAAGDEDGDYQVAEEEVTSPVKEDSAVNEAKLTTGK
jgi:hypothetical protein